MAGKHIDTIRDGTLTINLFENEKAGGKGSAYAASISRAYQDDKGDWKYTNTFSQNDLLKIQRLASIAYQEIEHHKAQMREQAMVERANGLENEVASLDGRDASISHASQPEIVSERGEEMEPSTDHAMEM